MPPIPKPSPSRKPLDYATQNWRDFADTLENDRLPIPMVHQHKRRVEAIAAIADQIRWTSSQMKPEYWPEKREPVPVQFFMSNLYQLRYICYEPLVKIHKHITDRCPQLMNMNFSFQGGNHWLMPAKKRYAEEFSVTPPASGFQRIATEQENVNTKMVKAAVFFEEEDKYQAHQQKVKTLIDTQLGHFEYEMPEMEVGQTWSDALRSTMRICDAAQMELERHYRLIEYTKTKSQWNWQRLDVYQARKTIPTRSTQELLLEIALQYELGSPTPETEATMAGWANETDVRNSLGIHLGRFLLSDSSRYWTNYFTHGIDHQSAAEPSMFFICQHKYGKGVTKWVVGGTTPNTGPNSKLRWKWADEVYKAVREQGMGRDWVDRVKQANDQQRELERQLMQVASTTHPKDSDVKLAVRQQVIATLRADPAHQRLVARVTCKGLSIDRSMVPTQCCYRCQSNFQYTVLSLHLKTTNDDAIKHLITYNWQIQCGWDQQCAESTAACQCTAFDDGQDEGNRPSSSRLKSKSGKTLSSKKSTTLFKSNR